MITNNEHNSESANNYSIKHGGLLIPPLGSRDTILNYQNACAVTGNRKVICRARKYVTFTNLLVLMGATNGGRERGF